VRKNFLFITDAGQGGAWWELTYSPSLGSDFDGLVDAVLGLDSGPTSNPVLRSHLRWLDALQRPSAFLPPMQEEWSITQFDLRALEGSEWVDVCVDAEWLRLKVHEQLDQRTFLLLKDVATRIERGLILDFNGSATSHGLHQAAALTAQFPRVYIEQPFTWTCAQRTIPPVEGLLRIFDAPDDHVLALLPAIRADEVVISKLGRNSPALLQRVAEAGARTSFGNVISTRVSEATLDAVSRMGSLRMEVVGGIVPAVECSWIGVPSGSLAGRAMFSSSADADLRSGTSKLGTLRAGWSDIALAWA
jgi:hypothetical protein